jgi:hypothetical protein
MIVSDKVAAMMTPEDRARCIPPILLPAERAAKMEAQSEKALQRLCEAELNRRNIVFLHLSFRAREKIVFCCQGPSIRH